MIEELVTFKNDFYLSQEIMTPTHKKENILDDLTNNAEVLYCAECNETLFSDHYLVKA